MTPKNLSFALPLLVACGGGAAIAPVPANESTPAPIASTSPSASSSESPVASASASASTSASGAVDPPPASVPIDAHATLGPFKNQAEACKALASNAKTAKKFTCVPGPTVAQPPNGAPIDRVKVIVLSDSLAPDFSVTHLLLHTSSGWFADPDGPESGVDAAMMKRHRTTTIPDGAPTTFDQGLFDATWAVRYDFAQAIVGVSIDPSTGKQSKPYFEGARGSTVICGLGASGKPTCVDPIETNIQQTKEGAPVAKVPFVIDGGVWKVAADASLDVLRDAGHDAHQATPLSGVYVLRFP